MNGEAIFRLAGAGILAAFFVVFFGKMASQKRQGMRTGLLKRAGKPKKVFATELTLKISVFLIYGVQIASIALDTHTDCVWPRVAGAVVGVCGVVIFGLAVRTMADSWRTEIPENDRTELVTHGIFRVSRNPAFLGFDLMFAGVCTMFFNPVLGALTLLCIVMYHLQILQEEKFLASAFGESYIDYMKKTRRYYGRKNTQKLR